MDLKKLKIKEIESVVKFTPDKSEFSSKNKSWHIIGIQLSGSALHIFKDRQLVLSENSIYFFNQKDDYDVKVIEKGTAFSVHFFRICARFYRHIFSENRQSRRNRAPS